MAALSSWLWSADVESLVQLRSATILKLPTHFISMIDGKLNLWKSIPNLWVDEPKMWWLELKNEENEDRHQQQKYKKKIEENCHVCEGQTYRQGADIPSII